ncbi:MAG: YceI family protein [Granulosicoccus sp.]|nr:YceI family protein [Granulosicoccus sp.]
MKYSLSLLASLALTSSVFAADLSAVPAGSYSADPTHAYVRLQYNHLGLSNPTLGFETFSVSLDLDVTDPTQSAIALDVTTDSVQTGSEIFHEHLTGEKWFDAAKYPSIKFNSTSIAANDDGTYNITGDLTVKDTTKPVTLVATINNAMMHPMAKKPVIGISATGMLKRSEFGLGAFTPHVGDDVALEVQLEMLKDQ